MESSVIFIDEIFSDIGLWVIEFYRKISNASKIESFNSQSPISQVLKFGVEGLLEHGVEPKYPAKHSQCDSHSHLSLDADKMRMKELVLRTRTLPEKILQFRRGFR